VTEIAYLGPPGTYSHLVAEKKFGATAKMHPLSTILEICSFVAKDPSRRGIVPIENSSGGAIYETVDILLAGKPRIHIEEELTLDVKLALLGREMRKISAVYSHFAPLEHCDAWLKRRLPRVQRRVVTSTAAAAQRAAAEEDAVALGSRGLAKMYGLDVLHYPVQADIPNITVFLAVAGRKRRLKELKKTTLAVNIPNRPGSLCSLLETFRNENVNLSRLISRPIRGCPREYAFLLDIEGGTNTDAVKRAIHQAKRVSVELRVVGSYPCRRPYRS